MKSETMNCSDEARRAEKTTSVITHGVEIILNCRQKVEITRLHHGYTAKLYLQAFSAGSSQDLESLIITNYLQMWGCYLDENDDKLSSNVRAERTKIEPN
jgi:hypothetical protein